MPFPSSKPGENPGNEMEVPQAVIQQAEAAASSNETDDDLYQAQSATDSNAQSSHSIDGNKHTQISGPRYHFSELCSSKDSTPFYPFKS